MNEKNLKKWAFNSLLITPNNITRIKVIEKNLQKRICFDLSNQDILFNNLSLLSRVISIFDKLLGINVFFIELDLVSQIYAHNNQTRKVMPLKIIDSTRLPLNRLQSLPIVETM